MLQGKLEESTEVQSQCFRYGHESTCRFQFHSSVEEVQRAQHQAAAEGVLSAEASKTKPHCATRKNQ